MKTMPLRSPIVRTMKKKSMKMDKRKKGVLIFLFVGRKKCLKSQQRKKYQRFKRK